MLYERGLMRRYAAVVGTCFGLLVGTTVVASPATAAVIICNSISEVSSSGGAGWTSYETRNNSSVDCDFRESSVFNPAVQQLQFTLNMCYGPTATPYGGRVTFTTMLDEDGEYGPLTKAAVKKVQAVLGLTQDGYAGKNTRSKMKHATAQTEPDSCEAPYLTNGWPTITNPYGSYWGPW